MSNDASSVPTPAAGGASSGSALRRRSQKQRADARHVSWLAGFLQHSCSHHTGSDTSVVAVLCEKVQSLAMAIQVLEGQVKALAKVGNPGSHSAHTADLRGEPGGQVRLDPPCSSAADLRQHPECAIDVQVTHTDVFVGQVTADDSEPMQSMVDIAELSARFRAQRDMEIDCWLHHAYA